MVNKLKSTANVKGAGINLLKADSINCVVLIQVSGKCVKNSKFYGKIKKPFKMLAVN